MSKTSDREVRVWDRFIRLFHWGTVALVATAFLSPDTQSLHEPIGYAVLALVVARIGWGFVGTGHARFADFVSGPRKIFAYLAALRRGHPERHLGHNPVGGIMILALLVLLIVIAISGWMTQTDRWFGIAWVDRLHSISAYLLLGLVGLHVLGAVVSSLLHRENLVWAMITGRKRAPPTAG